MSEPVLTAEEINRALGAALLGDVAKRLELLAAGECSRDRRRIYVQAIVEILMLRKGGNFDARLKSQLDEATRNAAADELRRINAETILSNKELELTAVAERLRNCKKAYLTATAERDAFEKELIDLRNKLTADGTPV